MKRTLEILISPTGEIQIDALGFKGPDCEQATRFLEEVLGAVQVRQRKPEYQRRHVTQHQQKIGR
jgi:hypothetical protein